MEATTILELYENHPERWAKDMFAYDIHGACSALSPQAIRWCIIGACFKVYGDSWTEPFFKLAKVYQQISPHPGITLADFNDNDCTTFEMILDTVRLAEV